MSCTNCKKNQNNLIFSVTVLCTLEMFIFILPSAILPINSTNLITWFLGQYNVIWSLHLEQNAFLLIKSSNSKDRQYNGKTKKNKKLSIGSQITSQKNYTLSNTNLSNIGIELGCSGKVSSCYYTSGTRSIIFVKNLGISRKWGIELCSPSSIIGHDAQNYDKPKQPTRHIELKRWETRILLTQVFAKDEQFLFLMRHTLCYW